MDALNFGVVSEVLDLSGTVEDCEDLSASAQITLTIQPPPPLLRTHLLNFGDTVYTADGTRQWQSFRLQETLGTASAKLNHDNVLLQDTEGATDNLLDWGEVPYWSGTGAGPGELQVPALGAQLYLHLRVRRA